jgi:hypothetical protein
VKSIDLAISRRAASQHALVHRRQALDLGMTSRQIQARIDAGLAAGGPVAASHRSAAWLWGLRGIERGEPELTVEGEPAMEDALLRGLVSLTPLRAMLVALGWRVLGFTWADVRRRPGRVAAAVAGELALACPA